MMIHKLLLTTAVLTLGLTLSLPAIAQSKDSSKSSKQNKSHHGSMHKMSADGMVEKMTKALNLNQSQQARIKPIVTDMHNQMKTVMSNTNLSKEDKMARLQSIRENGNSRIRAILTPEQQKKWDEIKARGGKHGKDKSGLKRKGNSSSKAGKGAKTS